MRTGSVHWTRGLFMVSALLVFAGCGDPRPALEEIPKADESLMEPRILEQYRTFRGRLDEALVEPSPAPAELAEVYGSLGTWHQAHQQLATAEVCYGNAVALAPEDLRWPYFLAHLHRKRGEAETARASFHRVLELNSRYVPALVWLGEQELEAGRAEAAVALFRRALEVVPDHARARAGLGRAALERGDFEKAAELLEALLAQEPRAADVEYALGLAYRGQGRLEEAGSLLAAADRSNLGKTPLAMPDPLLGHLARLVQASPQRRAQRVRLLIEEGRFAEAERESRSLVAEDPSKALHHQLHGQTLAAVGRTEEALAAFGEVLRLEPGDADAHLRIARIHLFRERVPEAEEHLLLALEIDPAHRRALSELGRLLAQDGRCAEALPHLDRLEELAPGSTAAPEARAPCAGDS